MAPLTNDVPKTAEYPSAAFSFEQHLPSAVHRALDDRGRTGPLPLASDVALSRQDERLDRRVIAHVGRQHP